MTTSLSMIFEIHGPRCFINFPLGKKCVFLDKYESSAYLYNRINTNPVSIVIGVFIAK